MTDLLQNPGTDFTTDELKTQISSLIDMFVEKEHAPQDFNPSRSHVAVSGKVFGAAEVKSLVESALDFWLTTGRFNDRFEKQLANFIKTRYALTCNSGSSANLLAASALTSPLLKDRRLVPGDEVITCATGFPTTVNPILQNNFVPVFVDVHIPTYNIDVSKLEEARSDRTRAIMVAHTLGNPFDIRAVKNFAQKYDLFIIEDCCDALGATFEDQHVGTFGDIGTLSFYPAHHITMGEGGAVFTRSSRLKRALESIRDWGRDCYCPPGHDNTCNKRFEWKLGQLPFGYDHKYTYSHLGYNLKITDMQAAVGLAQLERLTDFIIARNRNFNQLKYGLKRFDHVLILPEATIGSSPSWFGFPITVREPGGRDKLVKYLNQNRIATRLLFGGNLVKQPYMLERSFRKIGDLSNSDHVMNDTFWIGVYPGITSSAIEYVIEKFEAYFIG